MGDLVDLIVVDQSMEPVRTQEIDIALSKIHGGDIDLGVLPHPQRAQDLVSPGVLSRFFLGEDALPDEGRDERVVLGQRIDSLRAQPIEPTITHVCDVGPPLSGEQQADDRRAHPVEGVVLARRLEDLVVGPDDCVAQTCWGLLATVENELPDEIHRHFARDFPTTMSPESICDDQQDLSSLDIVETFECVLVRLAHHADIRRARDPRLVAGPDRARGIGVIDDRQGFP